MIAPLNKFITAIALVFTLALAGCVSAGNSVSGYTGPSVSSATAKRTSATKDIRKAKKALKTAKKSLKALTRTISRAERKLKRKKLSAKAKTATVKKLKTAKKGLRKSKSTVRSAERKLARANRRKKSADAAIRSAKRRQAEAKRRIADAKKKATKKQQIADARKQLERKNKKPSVKRGLFASSDPALKNVGEYKARVDGGFQIAAIPVAKVASRLYRQEVSYRTKQRVGTIVVDTGARFLYLVQSGGRAMRYGIGVGKAGFAWSGSAHIGWKQEWPKWTPPKEMIARRPDLAKYSADNGGMPGGPANPLGARALYLMKDGKDTLFRLHGTPQWASIGTAASSGCIRLMNQDVIDLYKRVPQGTKVVVI